MYATPEHKWSKTLFDTYPSITMNEYHARVQIYLVECALFPYSAGSDLFVALPASFTDIFLLLGRARKHKKETRTVSKLGPS